MEASAIPAPSGLARTRVAIGAPLLRLRSDEQLVALFRGGNNEAFRVIHDRYRQRLFAYTRQMLPGSRHDAEDALQDVFIRAYNGLRANDRELALRAWLYRVAHNRCIDELRRPAPPAPEVMELVRPPLVDPIEEAERRESLRRLIADVRRLPEQQRSALLMRELGGMSYVEVAAALSVSVPAIKSLLVRARVGLAQAVEARDAPCLEIRENLIVAHDRGVRATGMARRHMRECSGCREFRGQLRGTSKQFASLLPAIGPVGVLAKLLGFGGGAGSGAAAGGGAVAGTGAVAAGGILGTGTVASVGVLATGAGHVATLLAAAVVTAGGAVEIQHTIVPGHHSHHKTVVVRARAVSSSPPPVSVVSSSPPPVNVTYAYTAPVASEPVAVPAPAPAPASPPRAPVRHHSASRTQPWLPPKPVPNLTAPYGTSPGDSSGAAGSTTSSSGSSGSTGTGRSTGTGSGTLPTGTGTGAGTGTSTGSPGTTGSTGGSTTPTGGGVSGGGSGSTPPAGSGGSPSTGPPSSGPSSGGSASGSSADSTGAGAYTGTS